MFEYIRKHTRVMQLVLFLLIFPSFVLFGLEGYNRMQDQGATVARVDGRDINTAEWDAAHKAETDRLRQSMPSLDPKLLDSPEARYATLERMVRERVLGAAAVKLNLLASDQRLARELQTHEAIAALRGPDGKLDMDRYRQLVAAQGMTPEMFENSVRMELSTRQVLDGITASAPRTSAVAGVALGAYFEQREVQIARFATADFAARLNPTEAELETFYKENPQLFQAPEEAAIEYVVLDLDAVRKGITISEQDIKSYYEQNSARLAAQEERRASHILLTVPRGAAQIERDKVRARAEELLAAVRAKPDSFAALARAHSQDPGSAAQGGDLDYFARGAMTKPFEDVVFALKKGETSGVVETEFGYHLIRLTDIKEARQRSFAELRPELEADLIRQQAQRKFADSAESFSNTVYEQADSLKPVADRLQLVIRTAKVTRVPDASAAGPLANAKFLSALFSPDALERKRNTEAVETASNTLVSGRIKQYTPAQTRPFAQVRDDVRQRLLQQRGGDMARKEGQDRLAAWKAAPGSAQLPPAVMLSREDATRYPGALIEAALRADPAALPAWVGVDLGADGYAVLRVTKVQPRAPAAAGTRDQEVRQYVNWWTAAESLAYYNMLKDRFKARINVPPPARTVAAQ